MRLLMHHAEQFGDLLVGTHCENIYNVLMTWNEHKNAKAKKQAYDTIEAFLKEVCTDFVKKGCDF